MFKTKVRVEDSLFSDLIRYEDDWTCVRCGRVHEPKKNTLDCSHYWGRGHKTTRFDRRNCDPLCKFPCHQGTDSTDPSKFGWEYQKQIKGYKGATQDGEYTKYMKKKLGKVGFERLLVKAHKNLEQKIDVKELRKTLRKEIELIKADKEGFILGKH